MKQYLDLLRDVRDNGVRETTGATIASGEYVDAISVFGRQYRFDLSEGFPLVTTRRIPFNVVAHELIWMLRGWTNVAYLEDNGIRIWTPWADDRGDLGPVYGHAWRRWPRPSGGEHDQVAALQAGIREAIADPHARCRRRLLLTAWNPAQQPAKAPTGCHTLAQFKVIGDRLSCALTLRSNDAWIGAPFNIAGYALLTHLLAHVCGLRVGELVYSPNDLHVYANHLDQVDEQLSREPLPLPRVEIAPEVTDVTLVERDQIVLHDYKCHPALRGEVAV